MAKTDDLPWDDAPSRRLSFAPNESPYSGVRAAIARIREGMAGLDKYLGAVERDIDAFESELEAARASHGDHRTTVTAEPSTASGILSPEDRGPSRPSRDGKAWKRGG